MKLKIVATRDIITKVFGPPMFVIHQQSAVRDFINECRRPDVNNNLWKNKADFELWQLGEYDDEHGEFTTGEEHRTRLCAGLDAKDMPEIKI